MSIDLWTKRMTGKTLAQLDAIMKRNRQSLVSNPDRLKRHMAERMTAQQRSDWENVYGIEDDDFVLGVGHDGRRGYMLNPDKFAPALLRAGLLFDDDDNNRESQ